MIALFVLLRLFMIFSNCAPSAYGFFQTRTGEVISANARCNPVPECLGDPPASQGNSSQNNGSQYDAQYWNSLAMSVQTKLADQGYYHGQVDGVIGSGTIEAVRKFQADHGLTVTGRIDPKLLNTLGITYEVPSSNKEPSPSS